MSHHYVISSKGSRRFDAQIDCRGSRHGLPSSRFCTWGNPRLAMQTLPLPSIQSQKFELSPYLYMQFMEPLGTNDSSVEAFVGPFERALAP